MATNKKIVIHWNLFYKYYQKNIIIINNFFVHFKS